jgi:hypothetical protein
VNCTEDVKKVISFCHENIIFNWIWDMKSRLETIVYDICYNVYYTRVSQSLLAKYPSKAQSVFMWPHYENVYCKYILKQQQQNIKNDFVVSDFMSAIE